MTIQPVRLSLGDLEDLEKPGRDIVRWRVPASTRLLSIVAQFGVPFLWVLRDNKAQLDTEFDILIVGPNHPWPVEEVDSPALEWKHLASLPLGNNQIVYHFFWKFVG